MDNILKYEDFFTSIEESAYEIFIETGDEINEANKSSTEVALKNKAKKTGFPLGILRQVYKRGYAAWKKGHIPGTVPQQWAMARVNSFITGGKTTKMQDKALYKKAKNN